MRKLFVFILICISLFTNSLLAELRLPGIVSSNMVLQRNATVELWGWADPNEQITIKVSWLNQNEVITADDMGKWRTAVTTTNSKAPQIIEIHAQSSSITLNNVLFGEVWLCSGQSNMEMPVKGYEGQPIFGSVQAIADSNNPNLRLFTVSKVGSQYPLDSIEKYISWQEATPASVSEFSAVAYFFGRQLQEILDVPVGLISASWGASSVEAWMSIEAISPWQKINIEADDLTREANQTPTALYNAMIHPLIPYSIKGVIWYQGETDRLEPEKYKTLFPAMVNNWRQQWGLGDFPFYYVQIAPFYYYGTNDEFQTVHNSAFIREAQLNCLDAIPNSGMAITMDIGDSLCIHPPKKKEVADRLLYNALGQTYGFSAVDGIAPRYDSIIVKDGGIILKFKNAESGLYAYDELVGFEISGVDRIFYPAKAQIVNNRDVIVKSNSVPEPVAVRYAWRNWVVGSLYDVNLLPASSFRTDDWDDARRSVD